MKLSAQEFLEAMFAAIDPGTFASIRAFSGDPQGGEAQWWPRPWRPGMPLPAHYALQNAFVAVSAFFPERNGGRVSYPRNEQQFAARHAIMIDDIGTRVRPERVLLPPSALIETSPGNFQGWLFLRQDSDSRDVNVARRVVDRMVPHLTDDGTDSGMKGVTRFGRLPCGINNKQKYVERLGRPHAVRCESFNPERRYSIAEVATAFKLNMMPEPVRAPVEATCEEQAHAAAVFEALLAILEEEGLYRGQGPNRAGWYDITCPWEDEHSALSGGTSVAPPSAENDWHGGFKCHHGHCADRHMRDLWELIEVALDLKNADSAEAPADTEWFGERVC